MAALVQKPKTVIHVNAQMKNVKTIENQYYFFNTVKQNETKTWSQSGNQKSNFFYALVNIWSADFYETNFIIYFVFWLYLHKENKFLIMFQ